MVPVNTPLLNGNEKKYLNECIDTGWISSEGPFVKQFEDKIASYVGRKYATTCSSGTSAHYSNLLWGDSIKSLCQLSKEKGYSFIGCNSGGNNAYFIRNDKLNEVIAPVSLEKGYVESKYRESRSRNGKLSLLTKDEGKVLLRGIDVYNTENKKLENF